MSGWPDLASLPAVLPLRPQVKCYDWGSRHAIPELLGQTSPATEPQAELWMGTHPGAPSKVWLEGRWRPLAEVLGGELPFLFKVLAAGAPLSIQTHPEAELARRGFAREQAQGIDPAAPERNYRDPNPKPEILYALTPFYALRGFRPPAAIARTLGTLDLADLPGARALTLTDPGQALAGLLRALLEAPAEPLAPWLDRALASAARLAEHPEQGTICRWLTRLAEHHPGDRGLLAPLFLELATLTPGQALYTAPGTFHAYLEGCGLELMASSDNVLRGGLTKKHVDVPELLSALRFEAEEPTPLAALAEPDGGHRFTSPEGRLTLRCLSLAAGQSAELEPAAGSILLCTAGAARFLDPRPAGASPLETDTLRRGDTVFLTPRPSGTTLGLCAEAPETLVYQASAHPPADHARHDDGRQSTP